MKGVFLDYDTVSAGDLDCAALESRLSTLELCASDETQTVRRIADADVVMVNKIAMTRERLGAAQRLKLVAVAGTGTNHIDVAAAREFGIGVCNVRSYCTSSVAQHTFALILGLTRHTAQFSHLIASGRWRAAAPDSALLHPIRELDGLLFGVVGYGDLGRASARIAAAFGMRVLVANRKGAAAEPGRVDLDRLLSLADVVSLHCPLTESTRLLIGARELALMKRGALLINTARAALIDGAALAAALKEGRLGGAGIDVFEPEPARPDDPLLDPSIPNLLLTPHVAWAAREARQRCIDEMAANIEDFARGGRRGRVD